MNGRPLASVIVPAHDEEARIEHTLRAITAEAAPGELDVVVVCNGCSDATAEAARRVPDVRVIELSQPSKVAALREGDRQARAFPRIYLDADVELSTAAVRALASVLDGGQPAVAGVRADLDVSGSSLPVRWFTDFSRRLPVFKEGIIGAGVYAMNAAGRAKLGEWPDVLADDQYVLRRFEVSERCLVTEHSSRVTAPRDLRQLVRRGVRVRRGNRQLDEGGAGRALPAPPAGLRTAVPEALRAPRRWPGLVTFLATTVVIRVQARRSGTTGDWEAAAPRGGQA